LRTLFATVTRVNGFCPEAQFQIGKPDASEISCTFGIFCERMTEPNTPGFRRIGKPGCGKMTGENFAEGKNLLMPSTQQCFTNQLSAFSEKFQMTK
jgi:hypothetical protein